MWMSILSYLDIKNRFRISDLSVNDPIAIFAFVLLVLMIPIAIVMLTITIRRSVYAVFDQIRHEKGQTPGHRGVAGLRNLRRSPVPSIIVVGDSSVVSAGV
ncbi:hypothetical protein LTR08_005211 [Meristemomyces frigidus]|nr:hypothetical protein LTR08_005211 [Meristemomyces frigidus]